MFVLFFFVVVLFRYSLTQKSTNDMKAKYRCDECQGKDQDDNRITIFEITPN
jgi:ribosomal protein L44E